jgi:histidine phosphotransferase ChpT
MARQSIDSSKTGVVIDAADRHLLSMGRPQSDVGGTVDIRVLELLAARLCHELSGPLAAINNGIELLVEEEAALEFSAETSFARDAVALVSDSASRAGSRLQFYRFAYGSGKTGMSAGPPPGDLVRGFFEATRISYDLADGIEDLPAAWQKLACNLLPIGADALPRGGHLRLSDKPLGLEALGEGATLSTDTHAALMLTTPIADLTARTVHAYFVGLLAKRLDCSMQATTAPGRVRLTVIEAGA